MAIPHWKIVITEPADYSPRALALLAAVGMVECRELDRAGLLAAAREADALIVRLGHRIDAEVLAAGSRLRVVVSATTGLDHIDLDAAAAHGVAVLSLRGETTFLENVNATAEHTWALLLALLRRLPAAAAAAAGGAWDRDPWRGREVHGKTLGIVGCGRLGCKVAAYGRAFGMRVLAYDPYITAFPDGVQGCRLLEELLVSADVTSLHVTLTPTTRRLLGGPQFALMKPGALLVNTSRGAVIDEAALLGALASGRLSGAALDVLDDEVCRRPKAEHPLLAYARQHDHLLITPHIGGATWESMESTEVFMAHKLVAFLQPAAKRARAA